jgi:hypothetical protein
MMKIVIDANNGERVIVEPYPGAVVVGSEGRELMQRLMVFMRANAAWIVCEKATFSHPARTEGSSA